MAQFEESIRNQITALMRVMSLSKCMNEDKMPSKIEDGLFLGSVGAANNKDALKRLNVTHVLTVANSLKPPYPDDFVYKVIAVPDREDTNLRQYFEECIDFIDEAKQSGGGALVHCFVGRSRSVTIVVAYMMKKHGMTYSQAMEHVKNRRPQACPNFGFVSQLRTLRSLSKVRMMTRARDERQDRTASLVEMSPHAASSSDWIHEALDCILKNCFAGIDVL